MASTKFVGRRSKEHRGHEEAIQPAPERRAPTRARRAWWTPAGLFTWLAVGLVVAVGVAFVIIKVAGGQSHPRAALQTGKPRVPPRSHSSPRSRRRSSNRGHHLPHCPGHATAPPRQEANLLLTATDASGKTVPEILYMGAEYCPYCAAQRWSTIIALSRFGKFSGLGNMSSYSGRRLPQHSDFHLLKG